MVYYRRCLLCEEEAEEGEHMGYVVHHHIVFSAVFLDIEGRVHVERGESASSHYCDAVYLSLRRCARRPLGEHRDVVSASR